MHVSVNVMSSINWTRHRHKRRQWFSFHMIMVVLNAKFCPFYRKHFNSTMFETETERIVSMCLVVCGAHFQYETEKATQIQVEEKQPTWTQRHWQRHWICVVYRLQNFNASRYDEFRKSVFVRVLLTLSNAFRLGASEKHTLWTFRLNDNNNHDRLFTICSSFFSVWRINTLAESLMLRGILIHDIIPFAFTLRVISFPV